MQQIIYQLLHTPWNIATKRISDYHCKNWNLPEISKS